MSFNRLGYIGDKLTPVVNGERIGGGGADMVSKHNNQPVGANNIPSGLALGQG